MAGSGCILSPAELQQQQPQLFGALLALLTGRAPGAAGAAGAAGGSEEVQEAAGGVLLLVFGPENFSDDEAADLAPTTALAQALLSLRGRLGEAASDAQPAAVARLASALAERSPEFCCGYMAEVGSLSGRAAGRAAQEAAPGLPKWGRGCASGRQALQLAPPARTAVLSQHPCPVQAVALSELVLECLGRPGPDMAAHTIDYFLMANTGGEGRRGGGWWGRGCGQEAGEAWCMPRRRAGERRGNALFHRSSISRGQPGGAVAARTKHPRPDPCCPCPPARRLAVRLADRPPALRGPLYEAALQRLVPHATYPAGFTSWQEEFGLDEDAFMRLRWALPATRPGAPCGNRLALWDMPRRWDILRLFCQLPGTIRSKQGAA